MSFAHANDAPLMPQGIQIGDVTQGRAIIWSRADRPARLMIQYAFNPDFTDAQFVQGTYAMPETDFTVRQDLSGLPAGKEVYVKVWFEDLTNARHKSETVTGHFHTIGAQDDVHFIWGGDTAGQGWGINEAFGGMKIYEVMRQRKPQFFIQSGDNIYSDEPILPRVKAEKGRVWLNLVTPEVSKVAETIAEFRGRYKYNLLDKNIRRFNAEVPQIWQWDDHEAINNWSDSKSLQDDQRYSVKDVPLLTAYASQAFHEYAPMRPYDAREPQRIYRKIAAGSLLDIFVLDMRSYRGANSANLQSQESAETAFLGEAQLTWLQNELSQSKATWKVISADLPLSLTVEDGKDQQGNKRWEAVANGDNGKALGRELEIARLLKFIKQYHIHNIVWLTADVHYPAAHYFDPTKAQTTDFLPFWEFVAGPLNAGNAGLNSTDATFGAQVVFSKVAPIGQLNLSPYAGLQFFGEVNIDHQSRALTVDIKNIEGISVFKQTLLPTKTR